MIICAMCGLPAECKHHLIFGTARRRLADEDGLTLDLCNNCHNLAIKPADRIHGNPMAEKMSKMLGQAMYEAKYPGTQDEAREAFRKRYGVNYL